MFSSAVNAGQPPQEDANTQVWHWSQSVALLGYGPAASSLLGSHVLPSTVTRSAHVYPSHTLDPNR
ncbi:hypothetical protein BN159_0239 [Streptomyces davaonensis JCM 4913]|uniref:Uncharacterized protein n=1 Tax=Streptomyces davaonensis (strain DSM 101723 / JCM 4913 / KCC S-0913 / 768) TaxID=1214101 RepID=K4QUH7_STRDJ|nr:hypothetical protein BN159_0239 [Streptomyces davaonensis JCM 4913]